MSKVLLMDDNSVIRNSAGKVLSRMGHEVQCASHGEEAIALYKQAQEHQHAFDVVILDLAIRGGMGGREGLKYEEAVVERRSCKGADTLCSPPDGAGRYERKRCDRPMGTQSQRHPDQGWEDQVAGQWQCRG